MLKFICKHEQQLPSVRRITASKLSGHPLSGEAAPVNQQPASVSPLLHQQILHLSSALLERQKNNHNFFQTGLTLLFAQIKRRQTV